MITCPLKADRAESDTSNSTSESAQFHDFSAVNNSMMIELIQEMIIDHQDLTNSIFGSLTFGCDSMVLLDVSAYGNPHIAEIAKEGPKKMSGSTAHAIVSSTSRLAMQCLK